MEREAKDVHLENMGKLGKQEDKLDGITKTGYEAQNIARGALIKMRGQRDHIMGAINYTRETGNEVAEGKQLLNRISRKEFCYKLLLYTLICTLFLVIIGLMLRKIQ